MRLSYEQNFDNNKKIYLEKFIDVAKQYHIRLICIVSPTYEKFDVHDRIIGEIDSLTGTKGVEFYDYSANDKLYKKADYFKDQLHMNMSGVEIFNDEVSKLITHQ